MEGELEGEIEGDVESETKGQIEGDVESEMEGQMKGETEGKKKAEIPRKSARRAARPTPRGTSPEHTHPRHPRFARIAGFTLLEAIVAIAIFAGGGMALYGLLNTNLVGIGKAADVSRREPAVLAAVEHLSAINIREQPAGQMEMAGFDIAWSSNLVEPVRQGQSAAGYVGAFEIGLYDVVIELSRNGRLDSTYRLRLAGYRAVRDFQGGFVE